MGVVDSNMVVEHDSRLKPFPLTGRPDLAAEIQNGQITNRRGVSHPWLPTRR